MDDYLRSALMLPWILVASSSLTPVHGFAPDDRWFTTASGPTGEMGDPVTLTWSFVPDGTNIPNEGSSDLINFLDATFGTGSGGSDLTQRPWFEHFEESFNRWSELSGLTFVYEPNDNGFTHGRFSGALGVRGDIRIGGAFIDGAGDTLAYNYLPSAGGDMVLDTGDGSFFGNSGGDYVRLRNTVMHELGHGLGLLHIESNTDNFLLEPFISTAFDGPQFDDIRGIQWFYGDALERSNGGLGNDTANLATDLASYGGNGQYAIGFDATPDTVIQSEEIDFVSIDSNSDTDFFSFTVSGPSDLNATLTPLGDTYNQATEGGSQSSINTSEISDLSLTLYGVNGSSIIAQADDGSVGDMESLSAIRLPGAGTYYVSVTGDSEIIQFYGLSLSVSAAAIVLAGDYNGNGVVDGEDYAVWLSSLGSTIDLAADGDGNGKIELADYQVWKNNYGSSSSGTGSSSIATIPERSTLTLLCSGLMLGLTNRRRQNSC